MGQVQQQRRFWTITNLFMVRDFVEFEKWIDEITQKKISDNPAKHVATVFRQFETQRGNKRETLWRDKIA